MRPSPDSDGSTDGAVLAERVEGLATWIQEIDTRVRAAEVATGDERTAKELRKAIEALAKHDPKLEERLWNKVDVLADRVATLAGTVSTTTAALAGKDGEIAGLRKELALATGAVADLRAEVRSMSRPGELDELQRAVERLASERSSRGESKKLAALEDKIARLAQRLDTVSTTVSTATAGLAGYDGDVAALGRRLEEDSARLSAAVGELRATADPALLHDLRAGLDSVSGQLSSFQNEVRRDLVALGVDVETISHRVGALDVSVTAAADRTAEHEAEIAALEARIVASSERSASLDDGLGAVKAQLPGIVGQAGDLEHMVEEASAAATADLEAVLARDAARDTRVAGLEATLAASTRQVTDVVEHVAELRRAMEGLSVGADAELRALTAQFESGCAQVDALVGDLRESLATMPDPEAGSNLAERVDRLTEEVAGIHDVSSRSSAARAAEASELRSLVEEQRRRLEDGEAEIAALAHVPEALAGVDALAARVEVVEAGVAASATALETGAELEERLRRLADEVTSLREESSRSSAARAAEASELRSLVEEQRRRLEDGEAEIAALAQVPEALAGVDALAARVDAVETGVATAAKALTPLAGEGRFRVELRALELRIEHAEAAVRESRDAVLAQMDQIASLMESRLQHLESEQSSPSRSGRVDGQVIPIRSSEA